MTHHLLVFTDFTVLELPQYVPSVSLKQFHVDTISQ